MTTTRLTIVSYQSMHNITISFNRVFDIIVRKGSNNILKMQILCMHLKNSIYNCGLLEINQYLTSMYIVQLLLNCMSIRYTKKHLFSGTEILYIKIIVFFSFIRFIFFK